MHNDTACIQMSHYSVCVVTHSVGYTGTTNPELTSISNGLNLVDIKVINDSIKAGVKIIQKVNNLQWSTVSGNLGETNNITEVDGNTFKALSTDSLSLKQLVGNGSRKHTFESERNVPLN